jgi:ActR/RegA family two-component response regulator
MRLSENFRSQAKLMLDLDGCVAVVDDDPEFPESLARLLRSVGLERELFASITAFVASEPLDEPTCLVLYLRLPGRSGFSTRPWSWRRWRGPADRLHHTTAPRQ